MHTSRHGIRYATLDEQLNPVFQAVCEEQLAWAMDEGYFPSTDNSIGYVIH